MLNEHEITEFYRRSVVNGQILNLCVKFRLINSFVETFLQ